MMSTTHSSCARIIISYRICINSKYYHFENEKGTNEHETNKQPNISTMDIN